MSFAYRHNSHAVFLGMQVRDSIEHLVQFYEVARASHKQQLEKIEAQASSLPEQHQDEYWDARYDDLELWRDEAPSLVAASTAVGIYTALERGLRRLCDRGAHVAQVDNCDFFSTGSAGFLAHVREYLRVKLGMTASDGAEFARLDSWRLVRNRIAHDAGTCPRRSLQELQAALGKAKKALDKAKSPSEKKRAKRKKRRLDSERRFLEACDSIPDVEVRPGGLVVIPAQALHALQDDASGYCRRIADEIAGTLGG